MSDLVERLRKPTVSAPRVIWPQERDLVDIERREAADEIERLQAVVDAARDVCERWSEYLDYEPEMVALCEKVRALDGEP